MSWDGELLLCNDRNNDTLSSDFTFIKTIPNKTIIEDYEISLDNVLKQVFLDLDRQRNFIDNEQVFNFSEIMDYINLNPYLKSSLSIVLLFLTQIVFVIPLKIIYKLTSNINKDIIISEEPISKNKDRKSLINIFPDSIIVNKKLNCVIPTDYGLEKIFNLDISLENDLVFNETILMIKSKKNENNI